VTHWTDRAASIFNRRPFLLYFTLYAALYVLWYAADHTLPTVLREAIDSLTNGAGLGASDSGEFIRSHPMGPPPKAPMWAVGSVAMVSAGLLALPVAWLYTITRQKRGYNQSVVQTLILLPVVVAGVLVLVKFSLALAFSLAGIVAAVRFRNTLEDSKDAVYIFVVTGIGLAAGVELSAALALSIIFNFTTLLLFRSDFGRTPARLEGMKAEESLQRALAVANRRSQFVARLDEEVFEGMAPEQLQAVADRAMHRRMESAPGIGGKPDARLRVRSDSPGTTRIVVDGLLTRHAKRFSFEQSEPASEGGEWLSWTVKIRKSVLPSTLLDAVRSDGAPSVLDVELT